MKIRLPEFLRLCLLSAMATASAATYTDLTSAIIDEENKVYYNGHGTFYVESPAVTSMQVTIDLNQYESFQESNDYTGITPFVTWGYDNNNKWGLADYLTGSNYNNSVEKGTYGTDSRLTGYWTGSAWKPADEGKYVTYDTLKSYATDGLVTLTIQNTPQKNGGIYVSVTGSNNEPVQLYSGGGLYDSTVATTRSYSVNLNYVTAVSLNTPSALDLKNFEAPADYSSPYSSARWDAGDKSSVGRVLFLGDSITHGINDQTWRWQLFKSFVDNGIENEIAGPLSGYSPSYATMNTSDAGGSYGGVDFVNEHMAQASGRTHNMVSGSNSGMSGVNYGGWSSQKTGATYNADTMVCMMGTNDLLSDSGSEPANYCTKMAKMIGGTVEYDSGTATYSWTQGDTWGTMGTILGDVMKDAGDKMYVMSVPCWTNHANSNAESFHNAVAQYNVLLRQWVSAYQGATGKQVVYVESNRGLVDYTSSTSFYGNAAFFRAPGSDGLHPNEQGSLIMAGNLARAMGIGGRTAGLHRADSSTEGTTWTRVDSTYSLSAGQTMSVDGAGFTAVGGYTVDFHAAYGNGATDGWSATSNALAVSIGDGRNTGTLSLTEGYIMWGNKVLFCQDNSRPGEENLRIAYHEGSVQDNVASGYYVWLGDMLIGQGLASTSGSLNGISLTSTGASASISGLSYSNQAYAPTTTRTTNEAYAYYVPVPENHDSTPVGSGIAWSGATDSDSQKAVTNESQFTNGTATVNMTYTNGWLAAGAVTATGDINAKFENRTAANNIFAMQAGTLTGNVIVELDSSTLNSGSYSNITAALAGSYGGASVTGTFSAYVNDSTLSGDMVGGAINGTGSIGAVNFVVNSGTVNGSIYGGSKTNGTVGDVAITISGGTVTGSVYGGGTAGTVSGDSDITITGGVIKGDVVGKGKSDTFEGSSSVTVVGSKAYIGGDISADNVKLKNVDRSGMENGFDSFAGSITADNLTLDHYTAGELKASLTLGSLTAANGTDTLITSDFVELDALTVRGSTLTLATSQNLAVGALSLSGGTLTMGDHTPTISVGSLTVEGDSTLNADLDLRQASITLNGKTLNLGCTLTLGGTTLDDSLPVVSSQYVDLFTGVDSLALGEGEGTADAITVDAYGYIANVGQGEYSLVYDGAAAGGRVAIMKAGSVPEPAIGTLSLLALAGLCARRRRK